LSSAESQVLLQATLSDMIFAFIHLFLLLGILILAFYSLFQGNVLRFAVIIALLTVYYFIALHKNVMEEIKKKKEKGKKKKKKK
jgi:Ca2+/Na+ antiporter